MFETLDRVPKCRIFGGGPGENEANGSIL